MFSESASQLSSAFCNTSLLTDLAFKQYWHYFPFSSIRVGDLCGDH